MDDLAASLEKRGLSRCDRRELYRYRQFFLIYPQIVEAVTPQLAQQVTLEKVESPTPEFRSPGKRLVEKLSFTNLSELIQIDDPLKRVFYEIECIRGNWSVRELKRQIASLYYERSGLSGNKDKLAELVQSGAEQAEPRLAVRDPYVFEFLGLKPQEVMSESDLEDQLLDKLQEFLLEMGHGFCFEARQKRILIGNTHNFVHLVFYHRILKCHVLVELKVDKFTHEHIGQLNTYVSWYKKNEMTAGDNPPIGILLCTQKDETLVEYALAGMANQMFVSKYQLELPKKEEMEQFLAKQMRDMDTVSKGSVVD
jgi:predicted nuclease of restriction endonuclease-like (RecB) superfamily